MVAVESLILLLRFKCESDTVLPFGKLKKFAKVSIPLDNSLVNVDDAEETPDDEDVDETRFNWVFVDRVLRRPLKFQVYSNYLKVNSK